MSNKVIVRRSVTAEQLQMLPDCLALPLRRVFAARGVTAAELDMALSGLLPVSSLAGTAAAAERLAAARQRQQRVLVVGDFDADGATAAALMMICLREFGFAAADYLVPDRFRFGYGLSAALVDEALARCRAEQIPAPQLIVTVDNGISSQAGVARAAQHGIDVIITDHHLPGEDLPDAAVIVNPNLPGSKFGSKALAGVGVAFYVMAALGQRLAADGVLEAGAARRICAACLDLVALGTVADLVPLDFNNRVLVSQGLQRMRSGHTRPGIRAMFAAAGRNSAVATAADLGFAIAPRLNAAGRLEDISVGIECLLSDDAADAAAKAALLSNLNEERKRLQQSMQADADLHIDGVLQELQHEAPAAACLYDPAWHQGVVGLVANRIKDRLNRPVIVFARGETDGVLKGSGRSVQGVHMRDLLAEVDARHPGMISRFGGHAMAAGLSLESSRLETFRQAFIKAARAHTDAIPDAGRIWSDGELRQNEVALAFAEQLRAAGPWGQGFPEPLFDGRFELLTQKIVGEQHLKLTLRHADGGSPIDAIAFFHGDLISADRGALCEVAYRLDVKEYRGRRSPQLVVEHIECV